MSDDQNNAGAGKGLTADFMDCWSRLPNKLFFFTLLAAWLALFHFVGNGTFGYIATPSLLRWMWNAYGNGSLDGEDSHGAIVPILVIFLFWLKRRELLSEKLRIWWPGLSVLVLGLVLHVLGYSVQQQRISIVALFLGIYGLMGMAWGPGWLKRGFFPYFLVAFCIPLSSVSGSVTFPMRLLVTKIVAFLSADVLGVDVIREGTILFDSKHTYQYEVAAACSGIQSLEAIVGLSTVYAFLFLKPAWKKALMIATAFPLAILSNVIRLEMIILSAELFGRETGNYVHDNSYWKMFPYVPAFIGVMIMGRFLEEKETKDEKPVAEAKAA
jgi:exosortase